MRLLTSKRAIYIYNEINLRVSFIDWNILHNLALRYRWWNLYIFVNLWNRGIVFKSSTYVFTYPLVNALSVCAYVRVDRMPCKDVSCVVAKILYFVTTTRWCFENTTRFLVYSRPGCWKKLKLRSHIKSNAIHFHQIAINVSELFGCSH